MPDNTPLNEKEQSLIAVGASVAAGCRPCTAYHIKAAVAAGACGRGITLAVETALAGRHSASAAMDEWARQCQGPRPEIDAEFRDSKQRIVELTAVATAMAVNSVPDLKTKIAAARDRGTSLEEIEAALEIARRIKRVAEEKVEAAAAESTRGVAQSASAPASTGCCGTGPAPAQEAPAATRSDCGCR